MDLKSFTNSPAFIWSMFLLGPIGGMLVFAIQNKLNPKPISQRVQQAGGSLLLNLWIKEYGYWWLRPQVRALLWLGATPTAVTLGGLFVVTMGCLATGAGWFGVGGLAILLGSLSDMLDGMVARERNMCSPAGEFIDSISDRYADVALFGGLMLYHIHESFWVGVIMLAMVGSLLVSYTRSKAESLGIRDLPSGLMRRAERAVYLGFGIYLSPIVAAWTEEPSTHPIYALSLVAVSVIAVLTHWTSLRMIRMTTKILNAKPVQTESTDPKSLETASLSVNAAAS